MGKYHSILGSTVKSNTYLLFCHFPRSGWPTWKLHHPFSDGKTISVDLSCFTRPNYTFFLHIRSREEAIRQPTATVGHSSSLFSQRKSHRNCFRFTLFLSAFPTVFFKTDGWFDDLFSSIKLKTVSFKTTHWKPSNIYQYFFLFCLFLFLCGSFCVVELFSIFSSSTNLLFTDASYPRFHFFQVYLVQLSVFIMAESKNRAALMMFQLKWEEEYFLSSSIVNRSVWFAKSL